MHVMRSVFHALNYWVFQDGPPVPEDGGFEAGTNRSLLSLIENASSKPKAFSVDESRYRATSSPSRVPPPLNITEIGGYVNLLGTRLGTPQADKLRRWS